MKTGPEKRKRPERHWQTALWGLIIIALGVLVNCSTASSPTIASESGAAPTPERTIVLPTASPMVTIEPTETSVPTPEVAPKYDSLFEILIAPVAQEAKKNRIALAETDREFSRRIVPELNQGRVNILLAGYGDSHEPPFDRLKIASLSIISLKKRGPSYQYDELDFSHDIRDPTVEKALGIQGQPNSAQRIDQTILNTEAVKKVGRFALPKLSVERMTGLSVDGQIHFSDDVMGRAIDEVLGDIKINLQYRIPLGAYWYENRKYEEPYGWSIGPGEVTLNGRQAVGAIKAIALYGPGNIEYSYFMEHNWRKSRIVEAAADKINRQIVDDHFKAKLSLFLLRELVSDNIKTDLDLVFLATKYFPQIMDTYQKMKSLGQEIPLGILTRDHYLYLVPPCCTNDPYLKEFQPVDWVDALPQPGREFVIDDLKRGVFRTDIAYQMPKANPYGDAIDYWRDVRKWVWHYLLP